jgi:cephalosporin hydroxylase
MLDSNHTSEHVLKELQLYSTLVTNGMYIIVYDTALELQDASLSNDRPWGPGNGPLTAVKKFLLTSEGEFIQDLEISGKLGITVAPFGFLRKSNNLEA